jgi:hypothetical protein
MWWQPLHGVGVHHRGDAEATIEDTMGMCIQCLEGLFQELTGGRPLERSGPCGWVCEAIGPADSGALSPLVEVSGCPWCRSSI